MAFVHGRKLVVTLDGDDLSAYTNSCEFSREADVHDVTCYGAADHAFAGGLGNATATMSGIYDDTTAGPRDTIEPLIGTTVTLIRKPEGTGSGLPQDSVSVVVQRYNEVHPVADMVQWSAELQCTGAVTSTNQ